MKINNNLGRKSLKDYNDEANCKDLTDHAECLCQFSLPVLFAQASGGPKQKTIIVKVSMIHFFLIKSEM